MNTRLLTLDEAAASLAMPSEDLRERVSRGEIAYVQVGTGTRPHRMFHHDDIERFRASQLPADFQAIEAGLKRKRIESARADEGFVYFIRFDVFVKIGFSANPAARLRQLKIATPARLKMEIFVPGTVRDEKLLHLKFRRFRHQGEWFANSQEVQDAITRLKTDPTSLSAIVSESAQ